MAINREKKVELLEGYESSFGRAENVFLLGFKGIKVNQVNDLRSRVREAGGSYVVAKNTLVRRVVEGKPLAELAEHFRGPTAIAYSEDPVTLAKTLTEFAKDVPAIEFKGGLVDGQAIAAEDIDQIASLPSREMLLTQLVFAMKSPISKFVQTLGAVSPQSLVTVIERIREKKENQE